MHVLSSYACNNAGVEVTCDRGFEIRQATDFVLILVLSALNEHIVLVTTK